MNEEEKQKLDRKKRVEEKMKSLMEERDGEELMSVEEIVRRSREIVRAFDEGK
jgi:hypothetical protein